MYFLLPERPAQQSRVLGLTFSGAVGGEGMFALWNPFFALRRERSLTLVSNSSHRPWTGGYLVNTQLRVP